MDKKLLTAEQLAQELKVGVDTVVSCGRCGKILRIRISHKIIRFDRTAVLSALSQAGVREKLKPQSQQDRWYRNRNIQAALIIAAITVVGWFVTPYINKLIASSPHLETTGNHSPAIFTGPNSIVIVNINNYFKTSQ